MNRNNSIAKSVVHLVLLAVLALSFGGCAVSEPGQAGSGGGSSREPSTCGSCRGSGRCNTCNGTGRFLGSGQTGCSTCSSTGVCINCGGRGTW